MIFGKRRKRKNVKLTWDFYIESVIGHSHALKNIPNQDSVASKTNEKNHSSVAIAIADGHGASECIRSDIGASLAVKLATNLGYFYVTKMKLFKKMIQKEKHRDFFISKLTSNWKDQIISHLNKTPFIEKEQEKYDSLEEEKKIKIEKNPLILYGTTLLLTLIRNNQVILFQIGDGDILFVNDEDEIVFPIKRPDGLIANETTSLSNQKAKQYFQTYITTGKVPSVLIMSTDGYANSFSSKEDYMKVGHDMNLIIKEKGLQNIKDNLKKWLSDTTKMGSGDDISVAVIHKRLNDN